MRFLAFTLILMTVAGCAIFRSVSAARRFVDLPARPEPCVVTFYEAPPAKGAARLVGEIAIDATDPAPSHWQEEVRRNVCAMGGDGVWVTPLTERRDEWTYCGGTDSVCRDRKILRYLGAALVYESVSAAAPSETVPATTPPASRP